GCGRVRRGRCGSPGAGAPCCRAACERKAHREADLCAGQIAQSCLGVKGGRMTESAAKLAAELTGAQEQGGRMKAELGGVVVLDIPVLGLCYGMQWITHTLGGKVEKAERREYGRAQLQVVCQGGPENSALFAGVPTGLRVWNSHGDHVRALPAGFRTVGRTE